MKKIKEKILITGSAGFIGFSLANHFLNLGYQVYGLDNFDNYYSKKLKNKRITILKKYKNFNFTKIDIRNLISVSNFLKKKQFNYVFHLAAQPGVRYSLKNPQKYFDVNVRGFINILDNLNYNKLTKFFYASSSSVYGDVNKFPVTENQFLNPKNPYGISKKINEDVADIYSFKKNVQFIGLRFFTIYGEWGRPDMFLIKFFIKSSLKKVFELNNAGNHYRDFTYIGDVIKIINKLIKVKKFNSLNEVLNVCTSKPLFINKIANDLKKKLNYKKVKNINLNKADALKTHGNNSKLIKIIKNQKFTNIEKGIEITYEWYRKNLKLFF